LESTELVETPGWAAVGGAVAAKSDAAIKTKGIAAEGECFINFLSPLLGG
jgi:hypothetical protein